MSGDRRGFAYALEPVRSMTAWEIDEIASDLAVLNQAARVLQQACDTLAGQFAAVRADIIAQRQAQAALDIGGQRRAHDYMLQVQLQLQAKLVELRAAEEERDAMYLRLIDARKFAESLDRDREAQAGEHDQKVAKQGYQLSDDNWLQRIHWRKNT
ncbi:hypothetical protein HF313_22255 [Massilia atriviolacea]|uniref:Uncharacterized protein n=1 Tax=Massilia atriviolacea TaxID=2495579 RepID=A0A430HFK9_9BURK|nr:hypothetical protein [Massilia atriviolacea]RSZ56290.1 hypothetical protein EJB06_25690 [Massilia atriviolacea]